MKALWVLEIKDDITFFNLCASTLVIILYEEVVRLIGLKF